MSVVNDGNFHQSKPASLSSVTRDLLRGAHGRGQGRGVRAQRLRLALGGGPERAGQLLGLDLEAQLLDPAEHREDGDPCKKTRVLLCFLNSTGTHREAEAIRDKETRRYKKRGRWKYLQEVWALGTVLENPRGVGTR